jgi:YHS domain-containing protein
MAHQTEVHVIHAEFKPENPAEKVTDPVCGTTVARHAAKHVVFRADQTVYFCSRACKERFLDPNWKQGAA